MNIMELFSGIGGFTKGFIDAGYKLDNHYFSEIDKYAIANYKHNFKNAEYIGSVTDVRGQRGQADIITFGSPCQDFSLAGKRKGMEGERSSLIMEAIRLVSEIQPSVFIWENVKGTFSSNDGADFWAILNAFTNIGNYRLEWQLLNTSWFLPQNRERIYLIGHLTGKSWPKVFPIKETDFRTVKRQSNTPIIRAFTAGGNSGGHHSGMTLIKSNTKQGYEIAKEGDSINLSQPNSQTRRGRVGKEVAQTLDTSCNQGVFISDKRYSGAREERKYYNNSPTLTNKSGELIVNNIRRLTEIECERLQGFPDDWTKYGIFNGEVQEISKTQRYKMLGNAVSAPVVKEIAKRIDFN